MDQARAQKKLSGLQAPTLVVERMESACSLSVILNRREPRFADIRVRQAVQTNNAQIEMRVDL
jgi:hypothetical protein